GVRVACSPIPKLDKRGGVSLELVCHYRLHGNVESISVLPMGGGSSSNGRDSIILTFRDAKISVLEFVDSIHSLRMTYPSYVALTPILDFKK
ncbi:unnamed protein product, partial [Arabidopsis halleri]